MPGMMVCQGCGGCSAEAVQSLASVDMKRFRTGPYTG